MDSVEAAGATLEIKMQGLCQGNGTTPAGWAVISITILQVHKKKGHMASFLCPISLICGELSAILYLDDTDVIHVNLQEDETPVVAHDKLQQSVLSWGNLLIATGSSLKPVNAFTTLSSSPSTMRGIGHTRIMNWMIDTEWLFLSQTIQYIWHIRLWVL